MDDGARRGGVHPAALVSRGARGRRRPRGDGRRFGPPRVGGWRRRGGEPRARDGSADGGGGLRATGTPVECTGADAKGSCLWRRASRLGARRSARAGGRGTALLRPPLAAGRSWEGGRTRRRRCHRQSPVRWRARPATKGEPRPPPGARTARDKTGRTRAGERARHASCGTTGVHGGRKKREEKTPPPAGRAPATHAAGGVTAGPTGGGGGGAAAAADAREGRRPWRTARGGRGGGGDRDGAARGRARLPSVVARHSGGRRGPRAGGGAWPPPRIEAATVVDGAGGVQGSNRGEGIGEEAVNGGGGGGRGGGRRNSRGAMPPRPPPPRPPPPRPPLPPAAACGRASCARPSTTHRRVGGWRGGNAATSGGRRPHPPRAGVAETDATTKTTAHSAPTRPPV